MYGTPLFAISKGLMCVLKMPRTQGYITGAIFCIMGFMLWYTLLWLNKPFREKVLGLKTGKSGKFQAPKIGGFGVGQQQQVQAVSTAAKTAKGGVSELRNGRERHQEVGDSDGTKGDFIPAGGMLDVNGYRETGEVLVVHGPEEMGAGVAGGGRGPYENDGGGVDESTLVKLLNPPGVGDERGGSSPMQRGGA